MDAHDFFTVENDGEITIVHISKARFSDQDDYDAFVEKLIAHVETENWQKVVLNLEEVEFLTSSALGMFIVLEAQFREGRKLRLCQVQPTVMELFQLTHVDRMFSIDATEAESLHYLKKGW